MKPSSVLWKPKGAHDWHAVSLDKFREWITSEEAGATKVKEVTSSQAAGAATPRTESETRRATEGLLKCVIRPVLGEIEIDVMAVHEITEWGSITRQIIERVRGGDLVVANLTGLDANVMYELAIRHAARLPVAVLAERGTELRFDVQDERTLFFTDEIRGGDGLRPALMAAGTLRPPPRAEDPSPHPPALEGTRATCQIGTF